MKINTYIKIVVIVSFYHNNILTLKPLNTPTRKYLTKKIDTIMHVNNLKTPSSEDYQNFKYAYKKVEILCNALKIQNSKVFLKHRICPFIRKNIQPISLHDPVEIEKKRNKLITSVFLTKKEYSHFLDKYFEDTSKYVIEDNCINISTNCITQEKIIILKPKKIKTYKNNNLCFTYYKIKFILKK